MCNIHYFVPEVQLRGEHKRREFEGCFLSGFSFVVSFAKLWCSCRLGSVSVQSAAMAQGFQLIKSLQ